MHLDNHLRQVRAYLRDYLTIMNLECILFKGKLNKNAIIKKNNNNLRRVRQSAICKDYKR